MRIVRFLLLFVGLPFAFAAHAQTTFDKATAAYNSGDYSAARLHFKKACDEGEAMGCSNLGVLYEKGQGGGEDRSLARKYYREACDAEIALGCSNLATMHLHGDPNPDPFAHITKGEPEFLTPPDRVLALMYYRQACNGGYEPACAPEKALTRDTVVLDDLYELLDE